MRRAAFTLSAVLAATGLVLLSAAAGAYGVVSAVFPS